MLGQLPAWHGLVNWRAVRATADGMLQELGVKLDLHAPVSTLRVAERQMIEIARALLGEARCLILDEPTAALSHQEVGRLFTFIQRLRERGVAIIYITHRLDEVGRVADRVQVLRDGVSVIEGPVSDFTRSELVSAMVGKAVAGLERPAPPERASTETVLRFEAATADAAFSDLELTVGDSEVVGLYGKIGSGTAEVAEVAFGIRSLASGQLTVGTRETPGSPAHAIRVGVGFLPADRQREGAFMIRSVAENLCAPSWPRLALARLLISARTEATAYRRWHDVLGVRSRNDPKQPIGTLSGGNQQKVLLGRWLESGSRVLVLVEPTRGVDVGARAEIYRSIRRLAAEGVGVLVVTSDYEEVVQVADRAVVMARGAITAHLEGDEVTTERLSSAAGE
jgi:ribose transport system ATP-binding protein